jgi:hypothetical protein
MLADIDYFSSLEQCPGSWNVGSGSATGFLLW